MSKIERPYIVDELKKKKSHIIILVYMVSSLIVFNVFVIPEWLVILILIGFAVTIRALIRDKYSSSNWTRGPDNSGVDTPKKNNHENLDGEA